MTKQKAQAGHWLSRYNACQANLMILVLCLQYSFKKCSACCPSNIPTTRQQIEMRIFQKHVGQLARSPLYRQEEQERLAPPQQDGRYKPIHKRCPLASICMLWQGHVCACVVRVQKLTKSLMTDRNAHKFEMNTGSNIVLLSQFKFTCVKC